MSDTGHKRVPNFTSSETELLTTLVKKHANVLKNKKTDAVTNQLKDVAWSKLAEEFNSISGIYSRSGKTLRAKYENIKKTIRRKHDKYRRSMHRTAREPPPQDLNLTRKKETIMELAGPSVEDDLVLRPARLDSDMVEMKSKELTPNHFILKNKRSAQLTRRNPESYSRTMESYSDILKNKKKLVEVQLRKEDAAEQQQKIEHELRCTQLKEKIKQDAIEHELRCELYRLNIMLKKQNWVNELNN